jgi:hypothetical protein
MGMVPSSAGGSEASSDLIDHQISEAYRNVQAVAEHIDAVQAVSENLFGLQELTRNTVTTIVDLQTALTTGGFYNLAPGTYVPPGALAPVNNTVIRGAGANITIVSRNSATNNFWNINNKSGIELSDFTIDRQYSTFGDTGANIACSDCNDITIRNITFIGIGGTGSAGGAGFMSYTTGQGAVDPAAQSERIYVDSSKFLGDAANFNAQQNVFGAILEDALYSRIDGCFSKSLNGIAQEFKHNTRYSRLTNGVSRDSLYGFGYGQSEASIDGADLNISGGNRAIMCGIGFILGEAGWNLDYGMIIDGDGDGTGRDWSSIGGAKGVRFESSSQFNAWMAVLTKGAIPLPVQYKTGSNNNFVQIASHDTAAKIITHEVGSNRNVTRVLHPGANRNSVAGAIDDQSGVTSGSSNGNPVISEATGEQFGSLSGWFWRRINKSLASFLAGDKFRFENNGDVNLALATDGNSGTIAGFSIHSALQQLVGKIHYVFGATASADKIAIKIGNVESLELLPGGIIGFPTGGGGTAVQPTSKTTAITFNKRTGQITLAAGSIAAGQTIQFNWNNSTLTNQDIVLLSQLNGTQGAYLFNSVCFTGSAVVYITNRSAGALDEALQFRFRADRCATF